MSDKLVRISLKIDSNAEEIKLTNEEVKKLDKGFTNTSSSIGSMTNKLGGIAAALGGLYALSNLLDEIYTTGIEYNRILENLTNGLTTLNVVTSSNISSTGEHLSLQQKYVIATNEAAESVRRLTQINQTTPHTLAQTVEIYKAMFPSMRRVGITSEQLYDITQKMSIAAGSAGIEFQQLLAGVDGLATGTVLANSELGRFLNSIGLTNEQLKETDDLYGLINSKLKDIEPMESYDRTISNLKQSFDQLTGVATEPFFESIKRYAESLAPLFDKLRESILELRNTIDTVDDVKNINDISVLEAEAKRIGKEWREAENIVTGSYENIFSLFESKTMAKSVKTDAEKKLIAINERIKELIDLQEKAKDKGSLVPTSFDSSEIDNLVSSTLNPYADGVGKINDKWQKNFDLLTKNGKSTSALVKAWTKELEEYDKKFAKANKVEEKPSYSYDAHVTEYYKQKRKHESELENMYNKSTMSTYDYDRLTISKKYDEYKNFTESIAMLDAWRDTELQKINNKEYEEYKKLQEKKRREHGSFTDGAIDALDSYQEKAANAYSQGEQLFTNAMQSMEDAILDFVMTGKLSFSDLLSSIARMVIQQQVISPLAGSISGFIGSLFGASSPGMNTSTLGEFNLLTRSNGGPIPIAKYADGGLLSGGSGVRDDLYLGSASGSHVFAMGGEYIVNKDAVNALGVNTMDYINSNGQLPNSNATTIVQSDVTVQLINNSGVALESKVIGKKTTTDERGRAKQMLQIQMDLIKNNEGNSKKFFQNLMGA